MTSSIQFEEMNFLEETFHWLLMALPAFLRSLTQVVPMAPLLRYQLMSVFQWEGRHTEPFLRMPAADPIDMF